MAWWLLPYLECTALLHTLTVHLHVRVLYHKLYEIGVVSRVARIPSSYDLVTLLDGDPLTP